MAIAKKCTEGTFSYIGDYGEESVEVVEVLKYLGAAAGTDGR